MKSYYHIDRLKLSAPYNVIGILNSLPVYSYISGLSKASYCKWQHAVGLQNKSIYNLMHKEHPLT